MQPTKKSAEINNFLNAISGDNREQAIQQSRCIAPPIGCGKSFIITEFRDEISLKEFRISGWCQECQDRVFNPGNLEQ